MSFKVFYTAHFAREFMRLAKKYPSLSADLLQLIQQLEAQPQIGTPPGHNLFKVRLAIKSKGKGKSGGARTIHYLKAENAEVFPVSIYDKAEIGSIQASVLLALLKTEGMIS